MKTQISQYDFTLINEIFYVHIKFEPSTIFESEKLLKLSQEME